MHTVLSGSTKDHFVPEHSILRRIWSQTDITLFIFAGAAAEFALNREADWLYFTGRLPSDPIGRLFSTLKYSKRIIFRDRSGADRSIARINEIHGQVEQQRGRRIPDQSYRDVLFMLIYYSIAAFELLERSLTPEEKEEIVAVFTEMGRGMNLAALPGRYSEWKIAHRYQQTVNLCRSRWTDDLFLQYRRHLGTFRYGLLLRVQSLLAPPVVNELLEVVPSGVTRHFLGLYRALRRTGLHRPLIRWMLPRKFRSELNAWES